MYKIALYGGTFDPIHNGHIKTSIFIQEKFNFDSFLFMPCKAPTLKPPAKVTTEQRIAMLKLALFKYKKLTLDLREINRSTPSYTVETLESIRNEHSDSSITLIIGYDAFLSLPKWHQWEKILKLGNLLVLNRDNYINEAIPECLKKLITTNEEKNQSINNKFGVVEIIDAGAYPISSTEIRAAIKNNHDVSHLIPEEVHQYIKQQGLYR